MTGILSYGKTFPFYIKEFLDDIDSETADRYDLLTNKNVKHLFDRYNSLLISRNIPSVFVRPSKITENKIVLEELKNTSWQYFVDSVIIATERKKDLKATKEKETEIVKDLEK